MAQLHVKKLTSVIIDSPDGTASYEMPKGWRSITLDQYAGHRLLSEYPDFIEYRQFDWHRDQEPYGLVRVHAMLLWGPDKTGIAVQKEWQKDKYVVRYYAFGCEHQYKELSLEECRERNIYHGGRCYHVYECKNCKHIDKNDSSD